MTERLPLFPLSTVLFPGVVMPLYVFEDRYRLLVKDLIALPPDESRAFGVVAIKMGYEVGETGMQTIQRIGCAAMVTEVTANPDGTFEIVVVGRRRFHVRAVDPSREYLRADVEWLPDTSGDGAGAGASDGSDVLEAAHVARVLFGVYRDVVARLRGEDVLEGHTPDDPVDLSYTLAAALVIGLADRQTLLETGDVLTRLRFAIGLMRQELRAINAVPSLPATSLGRTRWCPN